MIRLSSTVMFFAIAVGGKLLAASPVMVSAASGTAPVAPGSIVSIYGSNLATSSAGATSVPLPTSLAGVTITLTDSTGANADLPLIYAGPTQVNAVVPATAASGAAEFTITSSTGDFSGAVTLAAVAPSLFSANESGKNVAAAQVATNLSDGTQTLGQIFQCGAGAAGCVPLVLNLSAGPTALVLYGTGIRNVSSLSDVTVTVGNMTLPATYAGPTPGYEGLDQVNVLLPQSLQGTGIVNVSVTAGSVTSNVLTAHFGFTTAAAVCSGCTLYDNPPYTFSSEVTGACNVSSVSAAGSPALLSPSVWPYVSGMMVYTQAATSANVDQLYIASVASNGALTNETCLSCSSPTAPPITSYKNTPVLRPQGDWILVRVEDPSGPVITQSSSANQQVISNNGYYANLWVTNLDGSQWYQLTHFTALPGGSPGAYGELGPRWTPDGSMVIFGETYAAPDPANLQGYWHLYAANFTVSASGVPSFSNMTDISLPGDVFYEPQNVSPDGSTLIVQSYTPGMNAYGVDLYTVNLTPGAGYGQFTDITNSPYSWDEHAEYSPDGQKIAYISSLPFGNLIPDYGTLPWADYRNYLHNEMFLMNADGTGVQQLTYFNTPGSPEATTQFGDAMFSYWNLAGSQLFVQVGASGSAGGGSSDWFVNFAGACGGSAQ